MPAREQTLDLLAAAIGAKYEVLQWIGGGGMADVFLARHRIHGGVFAVKVLADRLAGDPAIVARFLQEAPLLPFPATPTSSRFSTSGRSAGCTT